MIRFSEPGLLFLLPLLILLAVAGLSVMLRRAKRWDLLAAARLKHRLVDSPGPAATFGVLAFWGFAAVMLVLALARPEVPLSRVETTTHPSPVMFLVIDLSRSMRVRDVPPDRLTVAKLVARDMLESHAGAHVPYDGHPGGRTLDRSGRPVVSRMEPEVLEKIALTTSGARHIHRHHETTLGAIRDFVSRLETDIIESERESATLTLHPVPLALALASFLTGLVLDVATGRRRHGHQVTGSAPAVAGR